jgi:membrane fusion protein, multidrug efflux system
MKNTLSMFTQKNLNRTNYLGKLRVFLSVFSICLVFVACSSEEEDNPKPDTSNIEIRPDVIFATSDDLPLYRYLESQGSVEPARDLTIQPRISGFIQSHRILEGRRVNRGDTLLTFISDEWRLRLVEAQNTFDETQQKVNIERQLRSRDARGGVLSESEERNLEQQFGFQQAKLAVERAELEYSYTSVIAPFSGELHTKLNLSTGAYINAGNQLGQLLDHSTVRIRLDVLESELNGLKAGMDVEVSTPTGYKTTGKVSTISPLIDRDRKTGQIIVEVNNNDRMLKTGMTVNGRILIESHQGKLRAPRSVLLERDGRQLVFKLNGEMVEWVYVEPQIITPEYVILNEESLEPGDLLAVDRHFALSHQQKVTVRVLD